MARGNNSTVCNCWINNREIKSYNENLRTDGSNLYSYALLIGYTNEKGEKVALDYMASSGHFRSQSTSKHVSCAKAKAHKVETPK